MAEERVYTIPLRKAKTTARRMNKTPKAMRAVRNFLEKHMKTNNVKIGSSINEAIWSRGIKKPPTKIRVVAKREDGAVYAELEGHDFKEVEEKPEPKKEEKPKPEKTGEKTEKDSVNYEEIVSGTISEAKKEIDKIDNPDYNQLIKAEKDNKNRDTLLSWLESQKPEDDTEAKKKEEIKKRQDEASTLG